MKTFVTRILSTDFITHNVKRFIVEKPVGYTFTPGQTTEVSINTATYGDDARPYSFTSLPTADHLEFIIKIYADRQGMTEKMLHLKTGDELILREPFGTLRYEGPGLFIAGGTGITPFLSIFRQLGNRNKAASNTLLFANRMEADIILQDELMQLLNGNYHDVIEIPSIGTQGKRIDRKLLRQHIRPVTNYYYVCGPQQFTESMYYNLQDVGIAKSQIIFERSKPVFKGNVAPVSNAER